ncbi:M56 family metallopeptidase [Mucilaginibacter sp. FT3.2]|uniref:M56 family metallopeptidase n=1 Tax=Mucilaginibacter sp. FT3.2 TaxID=2723090 RepID=UPI001606F4E0|nr:M56 family metallopeptidase [Mucilaginibacter sp. FT3.2]MBB6233757.1 hypothetical protein [Mucilaginibacter sp. FT3.2]
MPALFVFLLKVNIALLLFCAGYYLVLRHLTFYTLNRVYLLAAILFASIYPQINVSDFLQRHEQLARPVQQVVINWQAPAQALAKKVDKPDYWMYVEAVFWIGAALLAIRLFVQLFSLYKLYKNSQPATIGNHQVRVMDKDAAPFSFWQSIFVNPAKHEAADLKAILLHEQVHVNQWHTLDILLAELSSIFYWFNPGIWLMKRAIRENVEFITDQKILKKGIDSKTYQYSLVSVSFNNTQPGIVNHFNLSTIKKRIIMMNAKRSSKINLTRYVFMVPVVVALLLVFSISKADFVKKSAAFKSIKIISNDIGDAVGVNKLASTINAILPGRKSTNPSNAKDSLKGVNPKGLVILQQLPSQKAGKDTSKKTVSVHINGSDSVIYYINGKKGELKSVNPDDILNMNVFKGSNAAQFVDDKIGDNTGVVFITTKDSPEGLKFKEKLDKYASTPHDKDITATGFNSSQLKGKVENIVIFNDVKNAGDTVRDANGKTKVIVSNYSFTTNTPFIANVQPLTKVLITGNKLTKSNVKINKATKTTATVTVVAGDDSDVDSDVGAVTTTTANAPVKLMLYKNIPGRGQLNVVTVTGNGPLSKTRVINGKIVRDTIQVSHGSNLFYFNRNADSTQASPLILIDGREASSKGMKDLDPNDIKNITVLKDSNAVQKYGDKAKQGVIMINLKKKK